MKKLILILLLSFTCSTAYSISKEEIIEIYSNTIDQWKNDIILSFNKAESEIYNKVNPDNEPVGPNEDPAKCICKGTGTITHGDGHTTPCPFHSKELPVEPELETKEITSDVSKDPPLVKINKVTCECETRCACDDCQCQKTNVDLWLRKTEIK